MYQSFFPFIIISFDQNNKKQIPILLAWLLNIKVVSDFSIKNFTIILLCHSNMSLGVVSCKPVFASINLSVA